MKMRWLVGLAIIAIPFLASQGALAQQGVGGPSYAAIVASCGTASLGGAWGALEMTATGNLCTNASGSGGGTSSAFGSAFPANGTAAGAEYLSTLTTVTSGQMNPLYQSPYGSLWIDTQTTNNNLYSAVISPPNVNVSAVPSPLTGVTPGVSRTGAIYAMDTNLAGVGGAVISLGQAAAGLSIPVVLPAATPVPTTGAVNLTEHDCSVTLTTGGTAQNAFAATATIHGFRIQNIDTGHNDEPVWFSSTTTAAAGAAQSYVLPAPTATTYVGAGSYTSPDGEGIATALSVVAATTGHLISCTYW
jgi:hypothetical protein